MSLYRRILIIIGVVLIGWLALAYALSQTLLMSGFSDLEEDRTALNVERSLSVLAEKLAFLDATAYDWASWDDTYTFIQDGNKDYIEANLVDLTFNHLGLNLILFVNPSGQIIFGKGFDLQSKREIPLPLGLQEYLSADDLLLGHKSTEGSVTGTILLPDGPMLVASRPILTSEEKGPTRGSLIMGRYLDPAEIERLAGIVQLPITISQINDSQMPADFQKAGLSLSEKMPVLVGMLNSETIAGYGLVNDIYGKPALILRVDMPRDIYAQGQNTVSRFLILFLVAGLVSTVMVLVFLDKLILSRLARISHSVSTIGKGDDLSVRVPVAGRDELSGLADNINEMLTGLEQSQSALRESEERYRALFDHSLECVYVHDLGGKFLDANQTALDLLKYDKEEITSLNFASLLSEDQISRAIQTLQELVGTGIQQKLNEFKLRRKDGEYVYVETLGSVVYRDGEPYAIQGLARDVTARKQAEEASRQSEERYRTILEDIEDNYFEVDLAGNLIFVNDSTCRSLGYPKEELLGMSYRGFTIVRDIEAVYRVFNKVYRTDQPVRDFSWEIVRKDGTMGFVEATVFPLRDEKGEFTGFRGVGRDVTQRKLAEEALRQSEEKYRTILEDIEEVYYEGDLDGNATFFNDSTCLMLGYSREELVGMNYRAYTAKEDAKAVYNITNKVHQTGKPEKDFCFRIVRKDGSMGFLEASIYPRRNEERKTAGFRLVGRDVTERKIAEQQVLMTSKLASIGELASGVAHELNNPLTGVMGYAELLVDNDNVSPAIKSDLKKIHQESQRAAKIVQNLLSFARQRKPEKSLIDINELIQATLDMRSYRLRTSNIKVHVDLSPEVPLIMADANQVQQVLLNTLVNAEQALSEVRRRGKISVASSTGGGHVKISIADNGPGIPKETIGRVLDPFFTTKDVGKGTGLGLSVCHGIVTAHGGTIHVESDKGKGATFTIEFPVIAEEATVTEEKAVVKDKLTHRHKVNGRILIVDDEPGVRESLTRILAEKGYQTDSALDAKTALTKIAENGYDLCIIDLKMPKVNGQQLYETIKRKHPYVLDKVMFITGDTITEVTQNFLDSTGRPYLLKPFNFGEMVRVAESVLRGGRQ